jgi:hypothetical protein
MSEAIEILGEGLQFRSSNLVKNDNSFKFELVWSQ